MEKIKDLISLAVELCKGLTKEDLSAVLDLLEKALSEIKDNFNKSKTAPETCKITDDNEIVVTLTIPPKRKRGRPRKDLTAQVKKESSQPNNEDAEYSKEESAEKCENVRRTSRRTIVPSKRYPNLLASIARQDSPEPEDKQETTKGGDPSELEKTVSPQTSEVQDAKSPTDNSANTNSSISEKSKNDSLNQESLSGPKRSRVKKKKMKTNVFKSNTCSVCGKEYNNRSNLLVHMRLHDGNKPYSCSQCGMTFSILSNMKRHEKSHSGDKPFDCPHCSKKFTAKRSLLIHLRQHTGERPYKCTYCEKTFMQMGTLKSHMHIHEGVKKHLCDLCGKSFRQRTQMMIHLMRHEASLDASTKRFSCNLCRERFVSKSDRDRHILKHTGSKPYLCSLCPKAFTRVTYLKDHIRRHKHHPSEAQEERCCRICGHRDSNLQQFLSHMMKHEENGESELANAWGHVTPNGEDATEDAGEETVIYVVDQNTVYMEHPISQIAPVIESAQSNELEQVEASPLTLVQQVVQESQIADQPCQTIVITEEQLSQLQHVDIFEGMGTQIVKDGVSSQIGHVDFTQKTSVNDSPSIDAPSINPGHVIVNPVNPDNQPGEVCPVDVTPQVTQELSQQLRESKADS